MENILSFDEVKQFVLGAERIWEEDETLCFCRFTEDEQNVYLSNPPFYRKCFSNSNMLLSFFTDGDRLVMKYNAGSASSSFFSHLDVKVDGCLVYHCGVDDVRLESESVLDLPLPGGKCKVEIFLPPLARIRIRSLALSNASFVKAAPRNKLVISYGDSITQGYHSTYPSFSYCSIFGESLGAEVINKGIGGDIFNPLLARAGRKGRNPDAVTIAYGTNDWSCCTREEIRKNCGDFLAALRELYPAAPFFMILPLWRKDHEKATSSGDFFEVREELRQQGEKIRNLYIVDGLLLTPHVSGFYSDCNLHPNDQGFILMGENLVREGKKLLPSLWQ